MMMTMLLLLAAVLAIASPAQVTGDFDGDGRADTAAIVQQPDGRSAVIVTFGNGRQMFVDHVDEHAALGVVGPSEIARLCAPFAGSGTGCTRQYHRTDRDGLTYRRSPQEVPGLALWNGADFSVIFTTWSPRAGGSVLARDAAPMPTSAIASTPAPPCRLKDRQDRIVDFDPHLCRALGDYVHNRAAAVSKERRTVLQVRIGEAGRVEDCQIVGFSGVPALDAKACSIVQVQAHYASASSPTGGTQGVRRIAISWPAR